MDGVRVLRADDPRAPALTGAGWRVLARSWAAELDLTRIDAPHLGGLVDRATGAGFTIRALREADVADVLALDAATAGDYVGGPASAHDRLTSESAAVGAGRLGFGAFAPSGELIGMTYLDVTEGRPEAEVDFTVVAGEHRGRGLATALKAFAVLELARRGLRSVRTGGSADNPASVGANARVGFVVDEHWITLAPPA